MQPIISLTQKSTLSGHSAILVSGIRDLPRKLVTGPEITYLRKRFKEKGKEVITINRLGLLLFICRVEKGKLSHKRAEQWRKRGEGLLSTLSDHKAEQITLLDTGNHNLEILAMAEGMALGNYQFLRYRSDAEEKESKLKEIFISSPGVKKEMIRQLNALVDAVYRCRSLVNEPVNTLNAEALAAAIQEMGNAAGIQTEVFGIDKIRELKMGGLLSVNKGSPDPPTFTIMEYKPAKPVNSKPIVLVGKGVVYDTGGLSLKPASFMDTMKSDMAGAAAVACALYAVAKAGLPVHLSALIPATDNRPDGNAYVPGDIITMMDNTTVEVLNTDAEGRLLLADALTYAKNYKPMLVIDLATLTGAAQVAIGKFGMVGIHSGAGRYMETLKESGQKVYERIAEFPFWDEYAELLKSEVADLKNIGGPQAGAITAGKFLAHFIDYPWIHLDIAGVAFLDKKEGYKTAGGTGVGVRLLFEFLKVVSMKIAKV